MKEYTPLRRFYAWIGFTTILVVLLLAVAWFYSMLRQGKIEVPPPEPVGYIESAVVTAYTSLAEETDDTPTITANGDKTHLGSIACPSKYAFGTIVRINGQDYTCDDRMAAKYQDKEHFDIWMPSKSDALQWGKQKLTIAIYD